MKRKPTTTKREREVERLLDGVEDSFKHKSGVTYVNRTFGGVQIQLGTMFVPRSGITSTVNDIASWLEQFNVTKLSAGVFAYDIETMPLMIPPEHYWRKHNAMVSAITAASSPYTMAAKRIGSNCRTSITLIKNVLGQCIGIDDVTGAPRERRYLARGDILKAHS